MVSNGVSDTEVCKTGKTLWLNFDSINYRANIWLNGRQLANAEQAAGMYRGFEFDVTRSELAKPGALNTLAVEVFPPTPNDLGITFVDWNPLPADKDMGLVGDVYLLTSGPVALPPRAVLSSTHLEVSRHSSPSLLCFVTPERRRWTGC